MKALINPNQAALQVVGWDVSVNPPQEILENIPDSALVLDVSADSFEVAPPLFWQDCSLDVVAYEWYWDSVANQFFAIPPVPPLPPEAQPSVLGAQTL